MTHIPGRRPSAPTRGDTPDVAGRSLRAVASVQKRRARETRFRVAASAASAIVAAAASVLLLAMPTGDAIAVSFALCIGVSVISAVVLYPARALVAATTSTAVVLTFLVGRHGDVQPLLLLCGGLLIALAGLVIHNTRRTRRGALLPMLIAQSAVPVSIVAVEICGFPKPAWLLPAAAATVACWAWRSEFSVTVAAWRAALRSRIRYVAGYPAKARGVTWMTPENLARGAAAEAATAELLATLGPRWHVLHSRALHNTTADADHIVIGPPGILLLDSKYRSGTFECIPWVDGEHAGVDWAFNGGPVPADIAESALYEADRIAWAFRAGETAGQPVPTVIVVHGTRMNVPWGEIAFDRTVADAETGLTQVVGTSTVTLVAAEHVVDYLRQLPARRFTDPTATERRRARGDGKSDAEIEADAQDRYVADLATVSEHLFIPAV